MPLPGLGNLVLQSLPPENLHITPVLQRQKQQKKAGENIVGDQYGLAFLISAMLHNQA